MPARKQIDIDRREKKSALRCPVRSLGSLAHGGHKSNPRDVILSVAARGGTYIYTGCNNALRK